MEGFHLSVFDDGGPSCNRSKLHIPAWTLLVTSTLVCVLMGGGWSCVPLSFCATAGFLCFGLICNHPRDWIFCPEHNSSAKNWLKSAGGTSVVSLFYSISIILAMYLLFYSIYIVLATYLLPTMTP